jgi:hypothetical protein
VRVGGKGGAGLRQVRITKTNAREPLMTCRKTVTGVETGIETLFRESGGGGPVYGFTGIRHECGVSVIQAWVRNVGIYRSDTKGAAQAGRPRKRLSTEVGHRSGVARREDEGSVMEPTEGAAASSVIGRATRKRRTHLAHTKPLCISKQVPCIQGASMGGVVAIAPDNRPCLRIGWRRHRLDDRSRMNREVRVQFWEGRGGEIPLDYSPFVISFGWSD